MDSFTESGACMANCPESFVHSEMDDRSKMRTCVFQFNPFDPSIPRYLLNTEGLTKLVNDVKDEVGDGEIVLLTIAGSARTGKSFLFSLLARYLDSISLGDPIPDDWWTNKVFDRKYFPWNGDTDRSTSGIWIWSKPFPIGKNRFLFLLDSEGFSDPKSEDEVVVALNIFLSSHLVLNVMNGVDEHILKLVAECGVRAQNHTENDVNRTKNILPSLLYLTRDWQRPKKHEFGQVGGRDYLEFVLKQSSQNTQESNETRRKFADCFKSCSCFLLPPPKKEIRESYNELSISTCSFPVRFKKHFSELCQYLFSKVIASAKCDLLGKPLKLEDFPFYADKVFNLAVVKSKEAYLNMLVRIAVESSVAEFAKVAGQKSMSNQKEFDQALDAACDFVNDHYKEQAVSINVPLSATQLEGTLKQEVKDLKERFHASITRYISSATSPRDPANSLSQEGDNIVNDFAELINRLKLGSQEFLSNSVGCLKLCFTKTDEILQHAKMQMHGLSIASNQLSFEEYANEVAENLRNAVKNCRQFVDEHGMRYSNFESIISGNSLQSQNELLESFVKDGDESFRKINEERIRNDTQFDELMEEQNYKIKSTDKKEWSKILKNTKQGVINDFDCFLATNSSSSNIKDIQRKILKADIDTKIECQNIMYDSVNADSVFMVRGILGALPPGIALGVGIGFVVGNVIFPIVGGIAGAAIGGTVGAVSGITIALTLALTKVSHKINIWTHKLLDKFRRNKTTEREDEDPLVKLKDD